MRSSWKLRHVAFSFFRKRFVSRFLNCFINEIRLWNKGIRIFSDSLERTLQVYCGNKFVELVVRREMLGHFLGSFVLTKRITGVIHSGKFDKNKRGRLH